MESSVSRRLGDERAAVVRAVEGSVLRVGAGHCAAAGIAWRDDLVVAPAESIADGGDLSVTATHGALDAQVLALDLATDVAVLRATALRSPPLPVAERVPAPGESLLVVGRGAAGACVAAGMVATVGASWRSRRGGVIDHRIEADVPGSPWFPGSAVLDTEGRLVGMLVPGPRRIRLVIPHETIERVVAEVTAHGRLRRAYLGVGVSALRVPPSWRDRWSPPGRGALVVSDVNAGSPAEQAGLAIGDLLLGVNDEGLDSVEGLHAAVRSRTPGETIRLVRVRAGESAVVAATLGERAC
jgi:S1-C subfamily serine protease